MSEEFKSVYSKLKVKKVRIKEPGRTGKNLLRLYLKNKRKVLTVDFCPNYDKFNGNDHNSLMMLVNGEFVTRFKEGGRLRWSITKKGRVVAKSILKESNLNIKELLVL